MASEFQRDALYLRHMLECIGRIVAGDLPALRSALETLERQADQSGTPPAP